MSIIKLDQQIIQINSNETHQTLIYNNGSLDNRYDLSYYPTLCCTPPNIQIYRKIKDNSMINLKVQSPNNQLVVVKVQSLNNQKIDTMIKQINQSDFTINHLCSNHINKDNYWSYMEVLIFIQGQLTIQFNYQYLCDPNFHPNRFDWSYLVMAIILAILTLLLTRFQKIYAFRFLSWQFTTTKEKHPFQGFHLKFYHSIIYNIIVIILFGSSIIYQSKAEEYEELFIKFIAFICCYFLTAEALYKLKQLRAQIVCRIRLLDLLSIIVAVLIDFVYIHYEKPWMISDFITLIMVGALIKLFKVTSLKDAIKFFIPCIIIDILLSTYAVYFIRYEWDSLVLKFFNTPLAAQIPYYQQIYKKKCGWISIISFLFPAIFISYSYRYDKTHRSMLYQIIGYTGFLSGLITWLVVTSIYSLAVPIALFTLVPMIGLSSLIAYQRNEMQTFWSGIFYDYTLMDPYKKKDILRKDSNQEMIELTKSNPLLRQEGSILKQIFLLYIINLKFQKIKIYQFGMTSDAQAPITKTIQKTKQCQKRGKPKGLSQIVIQTSDSWTSDVKLINLFQTLENLGRFVIVAKSNKRTNLATHDEDLIRSKRMQLYDLFSKLVKIKTICKGSVIFFFSSNQPLIQVEAGKLIEEQGIQIQQQNKIQKLQGIIDHQFYHFIIDQMNKPIFQLTHLDGLLENQNHLNIFQQQKNIYQMNLKK
ncbi:hypothetical protein pb186bvf_000526 [Paramecium bursaria]